MAKESTSDPESGLFVKSDHKVEFAYTAYVSCDEHNFVLNCEVTPGNVHDSKVFDTVCERTVEAFPDVETVASRRRLQDTLDLQDDGRNLSTAYKKKRDSFAAMSISTMRIMTVCSAQTTRCFRTARPAAIATGSSRATLRSAQIVRIFSNVPTAETIRKLCRSSSGNHTWSVRRTSGTARRARQVTPCEAKRLSGCSRMQRRSTACATRYLEGLIEFETGSGSSLLP